jgi:membrane protein implicated in regulation of membrane protease activity
MQGLSALLYNLGPWNWFIVAAALLILETMIPGVHLLWFGLSAIVIGFFGLMTGITWQWQMLAFGLLSVLTVFWVRKYARPDVAISDQPDLNERGHQYIGRSLVVEQAIQNGRGKVRVGDGIWLVEGPDAPAGARVTVVGAKGPVLVVERATA